MTILFCGLLFIVDIDRARIQWSGTQQGTECSYAGSFSIQCTKTDQALHGTNTQGQNVWQSVLGMLKICELTQF